jgi:hypothetical protein
MVQLELRQGDAILELQVWNANMIADDLIGSVSVSLHWEPDTTSPGGSKDARLDCKGIDLGGTDNGDSFKAWDACNNLQLPVSTGGILEASITLSEFEVDLDLEEEEKREVSAETRAVFALQAKRRNPVFAEKADTASDVAQTRAKDIAPKNAATLKLLEEALCGHFMFIGLDRAEMNEIVNAMFRWSIVPYIVPYIVLIIYRIGFVLIIHFLLFTIVNRILVNRILVHRMQGGLRRRCCRYQTGRQRRLFLCG